jgi:hypothetical protein
MSRRFQFSVRGLLILLLPIRQSLRNPLPLPGTALASLDFLTHKCRQSNGATAVTKNVKGIAKKLGARVVERLPDVGGGAIRAMRMAKLLQERLQPGQGERPGRPSVPTWTHRPKVPMSETTIRRLGELAEAFSREQKHPVTAMQVAAQLLEAAVERCAVEGNQR